jgi:OmcA/MtrC family decaheme c-type cytochrome
MATPVSWRACMSCHAGPPTIVTPVGTTAEVAAGFVWAGFGVANTGTATAPIFLFGGVDHAGYTAATNCAGCHDDTTAPATLASFHNGLLTERSGLLWAGADQSVELGATVDMQITGVSFSGTDMTVTWTAAVSGTPVDPCNQDYAVGPVFFGKSGITASPCNNTAAGCNSNLSILRAYAQANDWVNAGIGTSPGQPISGVNVVASGTGAVTTCAANVATSVLPTGTTFGTKGVVAIQGKPQMRYAGTGNVIQVRAKSPTREFAVADGALPGATSLRRTIVSTDKCDACHKGTLYQHGGNRVDNVDLCVMCHNPAANEGNNRANMGVTAAEAYDGKVGETYDMRTMVHAIHSAGESGAPLVYYRSNGIYFFGTKEALAKVTTWPGTGCQVVAGSGAPNTASGPTSTGPQCDTANTTAVTKNHNFIEVHYPRALNECSACHVDGWVPSTVDPTKAVAVTVNPGASSSSQADDVLMGPNAASCMSCHQSGDFVTQFGLRMHAYDQGWTPSLFPNGRQTLIDAVTLP